jgi:multicomponent Na+:H+ antiporter subunit F
MNVWLWAATALLVGLLPTLVVAFRSSAPVERLVALEIAGIITTLVLLLLAQGFDRTLFFDLALVMALLSFGGGLVYAHFLERWV